MRESQDRVVSIKNQPVTVARIRETATDAELRNEWTEAAFLFSVADHILVLEAQNEAYRRADQRISINLISKRRWFHIGKD